MTALESEKNVYDFQQLYATVKKHIRIIGSLLVIVLTLAIAYVLLTTRLYTAETVVLLDQAQSEMASDVSSTRPQGFETALVDSQVEILKSRNIAEAVLQEVNPAAYSQAVTAEDAVAREELIEKVIANMHVVRVGETYALAIRYTDKDPVQAAAFANAYARAYILDQIDSLKGTSATAAGWLQSRIDELRLQSKASTQRILEFRREHNLYDSNGRLINEDQLEEMNQRLGMARADTAAAQARHEFSLSVIEQKDINAAVAEAFDNDVINNIRSDYLNTKKRLSELTRILGPQHGKVKSLQQELREYEQLIFKEMERIAQSQLSDYRIAQAREAAMEKSLSKLIDVKVNNEALLNELQGLEQEADAYDALYKNYLEKFQQISQRQTFPISEARVISEATPPLAPSHPNIAMILAVALVMGSGLGLLVALYLEFIDRSLKTARDVNALGFKFLGFFPRVAFTERRQAPRPADADKFRFHSPVHTAAIDNAFSIHAETARRVKAHIDRSYQRDSGAHVIGIVSAFPHEGKSSVSINIAQYLAKNNCKTLLVDTDVRNPSITQADFEEPLRGLGNVIAREVKMGDALVSEARTGLRILSSQGKDAESVLGTVSADNLGMLLDMYGDHFDYLIVDLPPMGATADAYSLSPYLDRYILVAEWGETEADKLAAALRESDIESDKILGVILNKADVKQLTRYYGYSVYTNSTYYPGAV